MATGPPQGNLPMMTPFPVASDPPTPSPIPDVLHPEKTPAERAALRFSLAGKRAIVIKSLRCMIKHGKGGSIVLTASMSGYIVNTPQPHPAYAVSKAGVQHLARSLAGEWVGHGIRVNSISPGIMNTRLSGGESQAGLRRLWLERSPMGIGDPEDLTGAVVLLCSDASKFMTGTDIKLDGK
ncbi:MAG: hypothetical protein LQ351_006577 [Letrouitia transgressa]|nr:MAG: hypothetical protein LQ351_006577 [Letrouitia transgressa]